MRNAVRYYANNMYRSAPQGGDAQAGSANNGAGASSGAKTDDVIDAEYVDTDEKKREK